MMHKADVERMIRDVVECRKSKQDALGEIGAYERYLTFMKSMREFPNAQLDEEISKSREAYQLIEGLTIREPTANY